MTPKQQKALDKLETKLAINNIIGEPYPKDSIMGHGKICRCDRGYLCEHRREWIIKFIKENFL